MKRFIPVLLVLAICLVFAPAVLAQTALRCGAPGVGQGGGSQFACVGTVSAAPVADGNGLDVTRDDVILLTSKFGSERCGILHQKPVARRYGRDAAVVEQIPDDDAWENNSGGGFAQNVGERIVPTARGKLAGGGEDILW